MIKEKYLATFEEERFYHICAKGNSDEILFVNDENYRYFLQQFDKYLSNFLTVYAYCLLNNHIHFLVQIKEAKTDVIFLERLHLLQKKSEQKNCR
jgi:putative transposase